MRLVKVRQLIHNLHFYRIKQKFICIWVNVSLYNSIGKNVRIIFINERHGKRMNKTPRNCNHDIEYFCSLKSCVVELHMFKPPLIFVYLIIKYFIFWM